MRSTVRLLVARPGFAAIVLITLALGIGAPTAVFSVVHGVLIRPLPYPESDRLVQFRLEVRHPQGDTAFDALPASAALQWAADSQALTALALYNDRALTLVTAAGPERVTGTAATPNLLDVVGVRPEIGTGFDAASTDGQQIVLSHGLWQRHFAGDPHIVGTAIILDGEPFFVRGVMPPDFAFPNADAAFWVPLLITPGGSRGMLLPAVARLQPGATIAEVIEEGKRAVLAEQGQMASQTLVVRTLHDQLVGDVERVVWVVFAAVGLVTTVATANLALLLLVRGAGRAQEFGIRLALGATRGQLVRQLLTESLVLGVLGGVIGLALADGLLRLLVTTAPPSVPRLQEIQVDGPVLLFAIAMTLVTSAVFGVLSAGRSIAVDVARRMGAGLELPILRTRASRRRLHALAAMELAVTMVLLVAAGVLLEAFLERALVDQGFTTGGAVAARVSLPPARYPGIDARASFHGQLLERLQRAAGVQAAGLISTMPNRQATGRFDFNARGMPAFHDPLTAQIAEVRMVSEGFFAAMGMSIEGREFRADDVKGAENVIVLSRQLARQHFPDRSAIDQMLYSLATGPVRVIGVVPDVLPADGRSPSPSAYLALRQADEVLQWLSSINVVLRGARAPALIAATRAAVAEIDPEVAVFAARTLDEDVAGLVAGPRFVASVLAAFAAVALAIAAIGVYGVMSYATAHRQREVGIRLALGATRRQLSMAMLREGLLVIAAGLAIGSLGAVWISQAITRLIYEAPPVHAGALLLVGLVLAGTALLAAYLPTHRATEVRAIDALRQQ
jgi:putative ABC transport system permease protein